MYTSKFLRLLALLLLLQFAAARTTYTPLTFDLLTNADNSPHTGAYATNLDPEILEQLKRTNKPLVIRDTDLKGLNRTITYTLYANGTVGKEEIGSILLNELENNGAVIPGLGTIPIQRILNNKGAPVHDQFSNNNVERHTVYSLDMGGEKNRAAPTQALPQPAQQPLVQSLHRGLSTDQSIKDTTIGSSNWQLQPTTSKADGIFNNPLSSTGTRVSTPTSKWTNSNADRSANTFATAHYTREPIKVVYSKPCGTITTWFPDNSQAEQTALAVLAHIKQHMSCD